MIGIFDKYTASRSESSDGGRNLTRIAAEIECENGNCDGCSIRMAGLLRDGHHAPPAPPAAWGQPLR